MADFGTRLLEMMNPNLATANGEATPAEATPTPATEEPTPAEIAELERQLAVMRSAQLTDNYMLDLRQNPATMQPEGLLAGYDPAQARAAHEAQMYGRPPPEPAYRGPTIMDLQRLERAQQEAQNALYSASRI